MDLNKQLLDACIHGDLDKVKQIINKGINIHNKITYNDYPFEKFYPFEIASCHGHLEIVKYLHLKGAHLTINNNYSIQVASKYGHIEVVKYLYSIGCDPTVNNNRAIRWASEHGHLEVVKYLYSIGCDPTTDDNYTIYSASYYDHLEIVKFLALVGCDTDEIENEKIKKEVEEWLNEPKLIFNKCLTEIYGHPNLERTKTENEIYFKNYVN